MLHGTGYISTATDTCGKRLVSVTMSSMKLQRSQVGAANTLLLPVILLAILFIAAGSFAVWAFNGRQHYKNDVDGIVAQNVAANTKAVQAKDAAQYAEAAKSPLKTYVGPDAYGSVHISYPKTWSAYIDTTNSSNPVDAYFHADYVPATTDPTASYNLRVQVVASSYDSVLSQYQGNVQAGTATASPYKLPKVPSVVGTRLDGQLFDNNGSGTLILLPLRDKTLKIWIESPTYLTDFTTYILPNLTFSP